MILDNDHAQCVATIVVKDHNSHFVLVDFAGPRMAVKSIAASLQTSNARYLTVKGVPGSPYNLYGQGQLRYRKWAVPLPAINAVRMLMLAEDERSSSAFVFVPVDEDPALALARALRDDPGLVLPILPGWAPFLLEVGRETLTDLHKRAHNRARRLVIPLKVHQEEGHARFTEAYAYARDQRTWEGVINDGLRAGAIRLAEDDAWHG